MGRERIDMVPYARDAAELMGHLVRTERLRKRMTIEELSSYARVSKGTISAIENGKPSVAFGNVLNTCAALGIQLFLPTPEELARMTKQQREVVRLMPNRVMPLKVPDDNF